MRLILYTKKDFRYLYYGKKRIDGRNYKKVTIYHRGGAKKKKF